ncbi:glycosyltransferase family 4 protein [Meiothermus ruber]|jgi:UDP-GlcNAc:undecaprenyl-phosphate GlcNAc-1-phosphate transferase|uniref:Family 4 glycosyl transferase n=1 Tax=Meiothermus ruber (strain ATCC 35948 / DSM 1279 / VKM B-1258 / 21) TaxID=504728 RepID=D3PM38_MEIRD|nr:MraY family glycosyltransferase [Meiothermus ruber]ADD27149.1 glycosyl transferase family 4 [Meiothermus ruber DSM 1279]AGK03602.1 family 4 glycosyl transferase [Meiothermus ruber DSM 1279]MCL6531540.1 undecaprenyl/decaprenyl-phosphate alpha-N-acetylglucosaminyl 1-phosphate transferase [Meiothermus ruber]MCX7802968.1 undecaprenyl/decaprenyl-phosphate alpha-N-acetylglucosaminyl 1-phosphate transferase [Meiothermus ruber]GAO74072.1 family 4 glycosyl transferase [Meiothermus ruber H328]
MNELLLALLATLTAAVLVGLSLPLARSLGIVDRPGVIKIHTLPTPRFGGVGIVASVLLWGYYTQVVAGWALLGLLVIAITGGLDDRFSLSPRLRLLAELVAGVVLGMHFWSALGWGGVGLAVVLVLLMSNAVNLIDGMNGLAAGNALISAVGIAILLWSIPAGAGLAVILAASLLGFLFWNYPRAKTFMGDSGSLSIGYLLAMLLLMAAAQGGATFGAALMMVGFPLYDTAAGIIRRWRRGKPIFDGDRDHTYDRLDQLYLRNPAKTVAVVWLVSGVLVLAGLVIGKVDVGMGLVLGVLLAAVLFWGAYRLGSL